MTQAGAVGQGATAPPSAGRRVRRRDRSVQLLRAPRSPAPSLARVVGCARSPATPSGPTGRRHRVRPLDFDDVGADASLTGATHALQHVLGPVPHGGDRPRACRRQFRGPCSTRRNRAGVDGSSTCRSPTRASRRLTAYFRGKAEVERAARRGGRLVRRAAARHPLRRRGRAPQQHRMAPEAPAGVRRGRQVASTGSGPSTWTTWPRWRSRRAAGRGRPVIDAVGPGTTDLHRARRPIRAPWAAGARIVGVPGAPAACSSASALVLRDVLLTGDEYRSMADGLADTEGPATGSIALERMDRTARRVARPSLCQRDRPALPPERTP